MTFLYRAKSWSSAPQITEETVKLWNHLSKKKNWRIVQLPNGFFQTEYQDIEDKETWHDITRRETLDNAEIAINESVEHYIRKVEFSNGPKVVKTFE